MAHAATGIAFIDANRQCETSPDGEWDDNFESAKRAWIAHRHAKDAMYAIVGKPSMDDRPLSP